MAASKSLWRKQSVELSPEERRRPAEHFYDRRRRLESLYSGLLVAVAVLVVAVLVLVYVKGWSDPPAPEFWFLFGVWSLVVFAWLVKQVLNLRPLSPGRRLVWRVTKDEETGARKFFIQFGVKVEEATEPAPGKPTSESHTWSFGVHLSPLPEADRPNEAALELAEEWLADGDDLEKVCRSINSNYELWEKPKQRTYRTYLTNELKLRRMKKQKS